MNFFCTKSELSNTIVFDDPHADVVQFGAESKGERGGSNGKKTATDFDYDYEYDTCSHETRTGTMRESLVRSV